MAISSDDDLMAHHRNIMKKAPQPMLAGRSAPAGALEESSDEDDALLQRHTKRAAGAQGGAERMPRRTPEQQPPRTFTAKAVAKPQEPWGSRQSFRGGQLAFNPLHAPAVPPRHANAESDSDEEQWQRIKAGQVPAAAVKRLSAAAPTAATPGPLPVPRRLSLSSRPVSKVTAKAAVAHESDSDEEQWQRAKKLAAQKPKEAAVPSARASLSGRLSISQAGTRAAANWTAPKAQSDSDDERWAMVRAARSAATAGVSRTGGANDGQQRGAEQAEASDSDEEQWRRIKAQVTAKAPPASGGALPRKSRTSVRSQPRLTAESQGALAPRQRRSASMHAPSPTQPINAPTAARRASMPPSQLANVRPLMADAAYSRAGSFLQAALPLRRTAEQVSPPLTQPPPYQAAVLRVSGDIAGDRGNAIPGPPQVAVRMVSGSLPAYDKASPGMHRRVSVLEARRPTAEAVPQSAWEHPQDSPLRLDALAAASLGQSTANQAQQRRTSADQTQAWRGDGQSAAVYEGLHARPSLQQELLGNRRGSVACLSQPQMRSSRLSLRAPAQGELMRADGAFLAPPGPRTSFATARRASAPVCALPHIPEEPPAPPASGAAFDMLLSKRRSSADPSLNGGSGRSSVSLQPDTPQRLHERSRRSFLAPATATSQQPPQPLFDEFPPPEGEGFESAAFSAAYGVAGQDVFVPQHPAGMGHDGLPHHQDSAMQQQGVQLSSVQEEVQLPSQQQPDGHEHADDGAYMLRGDAGSLRRGEGSFTFDTADAVHPQHEAAHLPKALPKPGSSMQKPSGSATQRTRTLSESERSGGRMWLRSEPTLTPAAVTDLFNEPPVKQAPPGQQTAGSTERQSRGRTSSISSVGVGVEQPHWQGNLAYHPAAVPSGATAEPVAEGFQSEHRPAQEQEWPPVTSNGAWDSRTSAEGEDFSSGRATGSLPWSSIGNVRAGSLPMRQTGESVAWSSKSLPAGVTAGHVPDQATAAAAGESVSDALRAPEGVVGQDEGDVRRPEVFKVYTNQVAATTETAEQLLQTAQHAAEGAERSEQAQGPAMDRDALEVVIMHAVQASMASAFASLATDVRQLDVKVDHWSQRSEGVCSSLQRELSQLRRGTADDISAIGTRLQLLEAGKGASDSQPEPKEAQEAAVPRGSSWDQQFTMDIIERLDALEVRVACQLDQLTSAHEQRISAIKGNLHASVAEAAAVASSRPASPTKVSAGTAAADVLTPVPKAELPLTGKSSGEAALQPAAAPAEPEKIEARDAVQNGRDAGVRDLAKRVAQLEASHNVFTAVDRCKEKLALTDAVTAAALDKRLCTMEEQLHSAHSEAANASRCARGVQQRIAAAEWRIEKVATACAATVKALTKRQEQLANSLSLAKGTASLADAKCAALGAEIAKLYRDSGLKRTANSGCSFNGKKAPRVPRTANSQILFES